MTQNKKTSTDQYKEVLSHLVGGAAKDWKRLSKKKVYPGDIERKFSNTRLGVDMVVVISEREDGLLCVGLPNETKLTARLSATGEFNKAAQPSAVDRVMNKLLENEEAPAALVKQAVAEGLVSRFSFCVSDFKEYGEEGEGLFATIYPTVRDSTFKTDYDYVMPMVPGARPTDECMETEWRFPEKFNTPAKIAQRMMELGFTWDKKMQARQPEVLQEIEQALGGAAGKPSKRLQI